LHAIKPKGWVALFFATLLLVGLAVSGDYGLPADEPAEQVILQENMMEYACDLLGENSAAAAYYRAFNIQRISESIERDHGQCAYYPAAALLPLQAEHPALVMALWHAYTWLWFMVGVFALYQLARTLGLSRLLACAASLTLYLAPRFFAEGHYNNKDMALLSLVLCTLATGASFMKEPNYRRAALFSLAGAMAANTKIIGVFAWGLMGLATLGAFLLSKTLTARRLRAGLAAIGFFAVFYALLTPALWGDPVGYFRYVLANAAGFSRWTGVVLFQGEVYDPTRGLPLPHSYLPVMIALTVPVATLLLAAVGQGYAVWLCARGDARRPLLLALSSLWFIPMAYVVFAQPLLYNGWRHFYFIFAGIAGMAALGLQALAALAKRRKALQTFGALALGFVFLWQAAGIAVNHPYQYGYYNALAREPQARYELDYWDVSTVNAMRWLCANAGENNAGTLSVGARDEMSFFGLRHGYAVLNDAEKTRLTVTDDSDANYLFYNATYATLYGIDPPEGYRQIYAIHSYGNVLCEIYQKNLNSL